MGLDMYLEGRKYIYEDWRDGTNNEMEEGFRVSGKTYDLGYWRKHPNLHGYIVRTFAEGIDECQDIELDQEALTNIIAAAKSGDLPHTEGFFFGASRQDAEEMERDLAIFTRALLWLQVKEDRSTRSVVYRASW
jgi:hypothetical protein